MNTENKYARIAGVSFLISYLGLIVGSIILEPILANPLADAYSNAIQVGIGVLIESVNGIAVIGIAVMMYPILKRHNEGIALGYLGFRGVEGLLSILGSTKALSLIELSNEYIQAGSPTNSYFDALSAIILAERHWNMEMLTVFFLLGAALFYFLLYRTEAVPKYISVWGFIGVAGVIVVNLTAAYLGIIAIIFALPIIVNEFFIAIWLILKGVDSSTIATEVA